MTLYGNTCEEASMGKVIDFSMLTGRTPQKENEKERVNDNYNNYYYPGARARTRTREEIAGKMDEMRDLYDLYCDTFQRERVAAVVRREMAEAIEAGADPSLIVYAIEMAEIAPNPTWAYARAVMKRCMADKCRTYEDCAARAERVRPTQTSGAKRNPKIPEYLERDVTDDVFESGFFVDVMARGGQKRE